MKLTREIKTAILVIASILLFIWGYSFLKGKDLFTNYKTFYVEYDNVEGLATSAPVTLNGLAIGKINGIKINEATGKLLVELQLKTDFPISKSSVASIYEPGFIGGKQIAILPDFNDKQPAEEGQMLKGTTKLGLTEGLADKLAPVQDKVEKMLVNIDKLVSGLNNILDQKGQEDLKKSLAELSQTMAQFHKASASVNSILDTNKNQINGIVTNFNKVSGNFSKMSDSLNKADLGKTVRNLNQTLAKVDGIMNGLNSGKGTMGKLLKDEALYNNLQATSKELELLLQDVRLSPTRYVNVSLFGKKNKPYVAPVNDSISKK
ncbi:MlaD family protein [Flavobacterium hydatis]|uniref:Organic solvent ABC transporter substrate-binding protein n=1 Tax=Flavobacterium hydatis TaxID=991 RepID=A0A086ALJ5_FLAHY|nr:MlaD family protein [Flavobacterium hydatis]KFF17559.1 organic solvent ABC transporter substrate-binding protein [Flavobacterium hydatis]OXA94635.1 organic solvent ABC transporter substrate-binding protein [Flavobacterium hydatis]